MDNLPGLILFFFNDTATTEIYTLSLHDALPIYAPLEMSPTCPNSPPKNANVFCPLTPNDNLARISIGKPYRSEEHTSELQSHLNLVCRLLLEKKKKT